MRIFASLSIAFVGAALETEPTMEPRDPLDSSGVEKRKLISPYSVKLRTINFGSKRALQGIDNFMKRNGPIPHFEIHQAGQIQTAWAEEIELLSQASRIRKELPILEKSFQNAVDSIHRLGWAFDPRETISSEGSKTRLHAAMIQQLFLALKIVRSRDSELFDPDYSDEVYSLVSAIIGWIPAMTKDSKDSDLYEWALDAREDLTAEQKGLLWGTREVQISLPVRGFGPAIMTLLAMDKSKGISKLLSNNFYNNMKKNSELAIFESAKAHEFVRDFNSCSIKQMSSMITRIIDWLKNNAEGDSPLKECTRRATNPEETRQDDNEV